MRFVIPSITLCLLLTIPLAAAEKTAFQPGPADSYAHQTSDNVTVGAKAYNKPEQVEEIFGKKVDLLRYGVVPVLVVIENKGKNALDLKGIEVSLVATDGRHASAVGPEQLFNLKKSKPKTTITPVPLPPMPSSRKNPFNTPELVTRSFQARVISPGDKASGFFYFEAVPEAGDRLYLNGLKDARSGQDLFYFEFPLNEK